MKSTTRLTLTVTEVAGLLADALRRQPFLHQVEVHLLDLDGRQGLRSNLAELRADLHDRPCIPAGGRRFLLRVEPALRHAPTCTRAGIDPDLSAVAPTLGARGGTRTRTPLSGPRGLSRRQPVLVDAAQSGKARVR
jgi:hypothetical protein